MLSPCLGVGPIRDRFAAARRHFVGECAAWRHLSPGAAHVSGTAPWGAGRREPCTPPAVYAIAGTLAAMIIDYEK